jgi:hypothetical protein
MPKAPPVVSAPPPRFAAAFDQLHDVVVAQTGSADFGPDDYHDGLIVLLQSMDYDPHFTETGRQVAWDNVVNVLRGRVQAIRSMNENPYFDALPVLAPVVITGVPRTGTTALHRLMAVDPRFQGLQSWLLDSPQPRPPRAQWDMHPDFQRSVAILEARYAATPQKRAAHNVVAEEVHECCMLLRQSFVSNILSCLHSAATYRKCVQLIGSNDPDKRWLLKNPGHIENLDLLFAVFPDAKVIQTHRDPAKAVPSLVSLLMAGHDRMEEGRRQERGAIMLRREVAKWANAVRKADKVCALHPGQVMDVVHTDFHARPMEVLERIYEFIGMKIADEIRPQFARRIEEKPEMAHGEHRYSITDFGMTEAEAREPFGGYVEQFDLVETRR